MLQRAPRLILLVKSKFAHQAGYYLHNGRWHSVKHDKPIPKGSSLAHHPQAAGEHKPVVLTPEQIEQLKYPAEKAAANAEMKAFNEKHLPKLLAHGAAGDATALLGMGLGTNSHAKKQAAIANYLLGSMGSAHQVSVGQSAGMHAAVQQVPSHEPVPPEAAAPPAPAQPDPFDAQLAGPTIADLQATGALPTPAPAALVAPEFVEGKKTAGVKAYYDKKAAEIIAAPDLATLQALKNPALNSWKGKTPNSKKLLALFDQAEAALGAPATQVSADPPSVEAVTAPVAPAAEASAPAAAPVAAAPEPPTPVEPPAAAAPDTGKLTADQLGKLQSIPWHKLKLPDSNTNASSVNKKLQALQDAAFAGDVAAIEAMTWGKNTYNVKLALAAQASIAALKEGGAPAPTSQSSPTQHTAVTVTASLAGKPAIDHLKTALQPLDSASDEELAETGKKASEEWLAANPGAWDEANEALVHFGFDEHATHGPKPADSDPKDGDTKPGADGGTLVFKDGRWHKQGGGIKAFDDLAAAGDWSYLHILHDTASSPEDKAYLAGLLAKKPNVAPAAQPATVQKLKASDVIALGKGIKSYKKAEIKALAVAGDVQGLKTLIAGLQESQPGSKKLAAKVLAAMEAAPAVAAAAPKPKKAAAPAPTQAASPAVESIDTWQQTGPQGGSNPGGRFKDADGVEWYCKFPASEDIAKSEVLAAKLYGAAGVMGQDAKLITKGGKIGIASRWVTVKKAGSPAELAKVQGAQSGFAVDAWLGNWDVVGLGYDNLQIGADGKAVRVDAGGSLEYRAQGSKKPFGAKVDEIDTLRDAKTNPQAASIFGKMTAADITASVAKVAGITEPQIRALVEEFGPGDKAARKALADTLIARRADLLARYPKAGKAPKKRLDPTKLPVEPAKLPQPHDFANWNGAGAGLSSKPHINAANQAVEQAALDTALGGNLVALKEFKYTGIDKDTGNASATPLPIAQHPSKHVVQYHADLVQALDEIANPPEALKVFRETDIGTLSALDAAFPPKPFGTTVGSVKSNEKMGFWVALGQVAAGSVKKLAPKKVSDYSSAAIAAAKAKYHDAAPLAKHFIQSVQASGSYNDLFRDGKTHDHAGNKLSDVAQAALAHATQMPEGTSLYRWQKMTDQMLKHIMAAPDGTVFQATGPMCTSYSPTATAGFGKHRVTIRYAEGAKAVESFASGGFKGEKEVTTLPNNRFVILSKKMVPDVEHGSGGERLELEILMLPPDLGLPGVKG